MRKVLVLMGVALLATSASAQLVPSKAKGIKGEFVTAYQQCTSPSTTTNGTAIPACTAVISNNACYFGSKGAGKFGATVSKTDVKVGASLGGLAGTCEGVTLTAVTKARATSNNCVAPGICTTIDLPGFPTGTCVVALGKCSIKTTVEGFTGLDVFPDGTVSNVEIQGVEIWQGSTPTFAMGIKIGPL